jgi:hypothetical protein
MSALLSFCVLWPIAVGILAGVWGSDGYNDYPQPQIIFAVFCGILGLCQGVWLAWCILHSAARLCKAFPAVVVAPTAVGASVSRATLASTAGGPAETAGSGPSTQASSRRGSGGAAIVPVPIVVGSAPGGTVDVTASNRGLPVPAGSARDASSVTTATAIAIPPAGVAGGEPGSQPVAAHSRPLLVADGTGGAHVQLRDHDALHKGVVGNDASPSVAGGVGGGMVAWVAV